MMGKSERETRARDEVSDRTHLLLSLTDSLQWTSPVGKLILSLNFAAAFGGLRQWEAKGSKDGQKDGRTGGKGGRERGEKQ